MSIQRVMSNALTGVVNGANAYNYVASIPGRGIGKLAGYVVGGLTGSIVEGGKYLSSKVRGTKYQPKSIASYCDKPVKVLEAVGGFLSVAAITVVIPEAVLFSAAAGSLIDVIVGEVIQESMPLTNPWTEEQLPAPWSPLHEEGSFKVRLDQDLNRAELGQC
ncbi:hypothetical protein EOPP23_01280 [Endozoicomonas sp. OPT23]|uniref:hypothetical protein n=1 Tax=Endozoicomonas sp. OPT23 TaxID=2072845 RepID=UPI00129AC0F2|nr:hypothetical protein [Endozoicomonas sp. OPT23]MRI31625.1 hypothetical protein [Endozoicomonas sp. OPT23]